MTSDYHMMHIAFCTDTNYIMPTGVAMISVCENNQDESICFHLVITDEGTSPDEVDEKVKPLVDIVEKYGKEYKVYRLSSETLKEFICSGADYISTTAFARMFLPRLLDNTINKVLYLDCDIIVNDSLKQLWETELANDCPLAAAIDATGLLHYGIFENKTGNLQIYFNSGVLLINLSCWRKEELTQETISCALNYNFNLLDQDVLNYLFCDRFYELSPTYNYQILYDLPDNYTVPKRQLEIVKKVYQNPVIIHYISNNKPWKQEICPRRNVWEKYLSFSIWKGIKYTPVVSCLSRTKIYSPLLDAYWADPLLFQQSVIPFIRMFNAAVKLKNKGRLMKLAMLPLTISAFFLELVYQYKKRSSK